MTAKIETITKKNLEIHVSRSGLAFVSIEGAAIDWVSGLSDVAMFCSNVKSSNDVVFYR
jgi:hypothetical protein